MKPICAKCRLFFRPKKTGTAFEEGRPLGDGWWASYKLWLGDLYVCKGCGAEIIVGTGARQVAEHYEPDYADKLQRFAPIFRVDDC